MVHIELHAGDREALRPLFELAEDSPTELDGYLDDGVVLVAVKGEQVVGHLQLTTTDRHGTFEITNMAVLPAHQRRGIGRLLVAAAFERVRLQSGTAVRVATAAADIGNLRFYQRAGFRLRSVERDAFTVATGYPAGTQIDGIELRDRVWLDVELDSEASCRR
jgi:ribosomal protein S18 acetylase RimI-like enzyme